MKHKKTIRNFVLAAAFMGALVIGISRTSASLMIMPVYAVFEGRERTQDIMLMNTSNETRTYRMGWLHYKQNERGSYDRVDMPINENFDPETMIVFSPRQVRLPPKARQRVRMSLRKPPNLPVGEYRAHLKLQNIGTSQRTIESEIDGGVKTKIDVNLGFALPVIVRQGAHDVSISITDPQFQAPPGGHDSRPRLNVTLQREGAHGAMGRLLVYWRPNGGEEQKIGEMNNVNIFSETNRRMASIPLNENNVNSGSIRIIYEGDGPDKGKIFDEQVFPIGG